VRDANLPRPWVASVFVIADFFGDDRAEVAGGAFGDDQVAQRGERTQRGFQVGLGGAGCGNVCDIRVGQRAKGREMVGGAVEERVQHLVEDGSLGGFLTQFAGLRLGERLLDFVDGADARKAVADDKAVVEE
jgi:hypothetical protein